MKRTYGVIGGDRRQAELAALLRKKGRRVQTWQVDGEEGDLELAAAADVVILPLPLCRGAGILNWAGGEMPVEELFQRFRPGQLLLAGQVAAAERQAAEARGLTLTDYFLSEELTVANAAATAEAALQVAMEHLDRTLLGMDCLVLGFGRIGRLLACRLHGIGARVAAAARKPSDRAWIRAYGWAALDTGALTGCLGPFRVIFNTVPACLLDRALLKEVARDCLLVDLASVPGTDQAAAEELGIPWIWARSLPGRLVPATAAAAIGDAVDSILKERGDLM